MRNFLEFFPLIVFFIIYKKTDIITATIVLVILSAISVTILAIQTNKLAKMPFFSALIVGIFGLLTWYFKDPIFIKLKPTIVNIVFAVAFLIGYYLKKPFLKNLFGESLKLREEAWLNLTLAWGLFFLSLGILNEIVWRNFSENAWVNFKVFGLFGLSFLFTIAQTPYMLRHQINK